MHESDQFPMEDHTCNEYCWLHKQLICNQFPGILLVVLLVKSCLVITQEVSEILLQVKAEDLGNMFETDEDKYDSVFQGKKT